MTKYEDDGDYDYEYQMHLRINYDEAIENIRALGEERDAFEAQIAELLKELLQLRLEVLHCYSGIGIWDNNRLTELKAAIENKLSQG